MPTWNDAEYRHGDSVDFTAEDLFDGLHRAVEFLHREQPGYVSIEVMVDVLTDVARCAEILFEARNKLRTAKGLEPICLSTLKDFDNDQ